MVFGCFLEHDCDIGQVDIMILYKGYEMNGLHIDGLDGGDRMFRWLRAGSRTIQVSRKCVVWARKFTLPKTNSNFATGNGCLEYFFVSFWGPLHVFRGVLVSFSECKSLQKQTPRCQRWFCVGCGGGNV